MSFPGSVLLTGDAILKLTSAKILPLGTRGYTRDGRVFRYSRAAGTALAAGLICQQSAATTSEAVRTGTTEIKANTTKVSVMTTGTGPFTTANSYADGYLYVDSSSTARARGIYAQIKSHTTQTATSTGVVVINFYSGDTLYSGTTNIGSTLSQLRVIRNPYDKIIVKPAGVLTGIVTGVTVRPVTASYYFWQQTWGPCPVRSEGVLDVGDSVGPCTGATAGVVDGDTSTSQIISTKAALAFSSKGLRYRIGIGAVGTCMATGAAGRARMVFLKIAP